MTAMQPVALLALLLGIFVTPAAGASLRSRGSASVAVAGDPEKPKEIKEKYDKLEDFLEVIFTMACKWKNGKDINGLAKEKLKKGEVKGADGYADSVKEIQAKHVTELKRACGMIVASDKKKCREGCAARWNAIADERNACDEKCETRYTNFESACMSKADNLKKVFAQKSAKAAAQRQCYEGHCKEFPMVWMKADEAAMKKEVDAQCKNRCTDDNVKAGCQKEWALEVDMITATVETGCAEKSGVKKCIDDATSKTSTDYKKCKSKMEGDCGKAYDECKSKGNTDKTFKDAKAFCDDRKKMCEKEGNSNCLDDNRASLNKAEAKCKEAAGKDFEKCKDDELDKREKEALKTCIKETGPKCKGECEGKCEVDKMNTCLKNQKSEDGGKMFCDDFWTLLHTNSETDPVTGNPIVLFAPKGKVIRRE